MILRRYGRTMESVAVHFDARALNEVGFRRNHERSLDAEEFADAYRRVDGRELSATAEGPVQDEAEEALLEELEAELRQILDALGDDEVLVVESERDDWPKTRDEKKKVVVEGENRLYFHWRVEPPLRVAVYRKAE